MLYGLKRIRGCEDFLFDFSEKRKFYFPNSDAFPDCVFRFSFFVERRARQSGGRGGRKRVIEREKRDKIRGERRGTKGEYKTISS